MSTSTLSVEQTTTPQAEAAEARIKERRHAIQKLYEDQQRQTLDGDYWFSATLQTTSLIFYTVVKLENMSFTDSSLVLEFDGTMYGPGLGTARAFGGGYTYKDPEWLVGKEFDFELIWVALPTAGVQMTIWYEGTIVAAFDAVGAGIGGGGGWGSGTFKRA